MKKILTAVVAAGVLLTAAACDDSAASTKATKHSKAHKTTSHAVTLRAHTSGAGGPDRWFLTLKGKKRPVSVSKRTYTRCTIGDRFPACADG
jgi:Ni/Co efflux regulator RcnB